MNGWRLNWIDYYAVLEIERTANQKTIKKKFRELVTKYHPDVCKEENAEEKFKEINEAYTILSNEEEKKAYDLVWDARRDGLYETEEHNSYESNYDDIKNNYTAEEKRFAKKLALKKIIEEELQKVELVITSKSEIIFNAYSGKIEKKEYYFSIKELVNIGFSFINDLKLLSIEAYKYDLLGEEELIKQTMEYLEQELKSIPLTPNDAKVYMDEEIFKNSVKNEIIVKTEVSENIIKKLKMILIGSYQKEITHLEYRNILTSVLWEAKENLSHLKELHKIAGTLNLEEECQVLIESISKLDGMLIWMPHDYEKAVIAGKEEFVKEEIRNAIVSANEIENKVNRISKLLLKYPNSWRYKDLYNYTLSYFNESLEHLTEIYKKREPILDTVSTNNKKAEGLSKKAINIYKQAELLHTKANDIYTQKKTSHNNENIVTLSESALALWDKGKALELLLEAQELIETINALNKNDVEFKNLCEQLYQEIIKISMLKIDLENLSKETVNLKSRINQAKTDVFNNAVCATVTVAMGLVNTILASGNGISLLSKIRAENFAVEQLLLCFGFSLSSFIFFCISYGYIGYMMFYKKKLNRLLDEYQNNQTYTKTRNY